MDNLLNIVGKNIQAQQTNAPQQANAKPDANIIANKDVDNNSFKQALDNANDKPPVQEVEKAETKTQNSAPAEQTKETSTTNNHNTDNKVTSPQQTNATQATEAESLESTITDQPTVKEGLIALNNILADLIKQNQTTPATNSQAINSELIAAAANAQASGDQENITDVNTLLLNSALATTQITPVEADGQTDIAAQNQQQIQVQPQTSIVLNLLSGAFSAAQIIEPVADNVVSNPLAVQVDAVTSVSAKSTNSDPANILQKQATQIAANTTTETQNIVTQTAAETILNKGVNLLSEKPLTQTTAKDALAKEADVKATVDLASKITFLAPASSAEQNKDKKDSLFGDSKPLFSLDSKPASSDVDFDSFVNGFDVNKRIDLGRSTNIDSGIKVADSGKFIHSTIDEAPYKIVAALKDGHSKINIKLDPAELGRIEVRLDMNRNEGVVKLIVTADRADSLEVLQKESKNLEKALMDVGFKSESTSLNFNLRGNGEQWKNNNQDLAGNNQQAAGDFDDDLDQQNYVNPAMLLSMDKVVDIRV